MSNREISLAHRVFLASRPISWINTAYPFAVTYYLLTGSVDWRLVIGSVFFLIPYNVVMYGVNDVFDYFSDAQNPRKGGVEGALLPPATHRSVLMICAVISAPFILWLVFNGPVVSAVILFLLMVDVVAYSAPPLRTKERAFLDSLTSSVHFVGPMIYAISLAPVAWSSSLLIIIGSFLAWGVAAHAFGAVQDIIPDREAGLRSIATEIGARRTVLLALGLWVVSGCLLLFLGLPDAVVALAVVPYIVLAAPFVGISDESSALAHGGWKNFLWINYSVGFLITVFLIIRTLLG